MKDYTRTYGVIQDPMEDMGPWDHMEKYWAIRVNAGP